MKATKTVSQQQQPEGRRPTLSEMVLGSAGEIDTPGESWMNDNLALLIEFIKAPTMDNAHSTVSIAFSRIVAITEGMTVRNGIPLEDEQWHYIASTLLLNAEIMRRGFELVFDFGRASNANRKAE